MTTEQLQAEIARVIEPVGACAKGTVMSTDVERDDNYREMALIDAQARRPTICPACGARLVREKAFGNEPECPKCGWPFPVCEECGEPLSDGEVVRCADCAREMGVPG